jgi:acetyl-CoA carboxylase carboxyltransferase component
LTVNHADRVIAEAKQAVLDYRAFTVDHPDAPALQALMEEAYRTAMHLPGWQARQLVVPEVVDIVSTYSRLRGAAETAKHTLAIYGERV